MMLTKSYLAGILAILVLMGGNTAAPAQGQNPDKQTSPPAEEVARMLRDEPITLDTWPVWRARLLSWLGDRSHNADAAYDAALAFVGSQFSQDRFPGALNDDALVWYLHGFSDIRNIKRAVDIPVQAELAETALRRSLQLDPKFGRAHYRLALALLLRADYVSKAPDPRRDEGYKELQTAREMDDTLSMVELEAYVAAMQERWPDAEVLFKQASRESPADNDLARAAARCVVSNQAHKGRFAPDVVVLCNRFPRDGTLACLHAVALVLDQDPKAAASQLRLARQLGTDPNTVLPPQLVQQIESVGGPTWVDSYVWPFGWLMLFFTIFYGVVMLCMASAGFFLAGYTRGTNALHLLGVQPEELVTEGQVARVSHESALARLYGLALFAGLLLFYAAIPFVIVGLIAATGLLLYFTLMLNRIPIKLLLIILFVGLGGAWAVLKSAFARPASGGFGLQKTEADCPRLFEALGDVARRVDTQPIDDIYLSPTSGIGVHQEGSGPFGLFGLKRRVLTLGFSTMHFLTVNELKAVLAHEYAHFSHSDTFYSRFIYQVHMSIEGALRGMGEYGGWYNYVNPFYWFLYLYYRSYSLLAAGYSRSREFLADRMASSLYGSDVFGDALTKVSTDGQLFDSTMYDNVQKMLHQNQAFVNMYEAFRSQADEQLSGQQREELFQKLMAEKGSLFASHPTIAERLDAVAALPAARSRDTTPAVDLLDNAEDVEKELTSFLTDWMHHIAQLQAQAAKT
jgi:Zn-dependent protease with chaperone function